MSKNDLHKKWQSTSIVLLIALQTMRKNLVFILKDEKQDTTLFVLDTILEKHFTVLVKPQNDLFKKDLP